MSTNVQQIFDLLPKPGTPERQKIVAELVLELTRTAESGPIRLHGKGSEVIGCFMRLHEPSGIPAPMLTPLQEAEVKRNIANRDAAFEADEMLNRLHSDPSRRI